MTSKPELFELVTWADVEAGDHVWYMGNVMLIRDGEWSVYYDPDHEQYPMRPDLRRVPVRDETGHEFAPPVELTDRVTRLVPPERSITEKGCDAEVRHGPGHQSSTKCDLTGAHDVHRAIYMGTEATWRGPFVYTGVFDEPPVTD